MQTQEKHWSPQISATESAQERIKGAKELVPQYEQLVTWKKIIVTPNLSIFLNSFFGKPANVKSSFLGKLWNPSLFFDKPVNKWDKIVIGNIWYTNSIVWKNAYKLPTVNISVEKNNWKIYTLFKPITEKEALLSFIKTINTTESDSIINSWSRTTKSMIEKLYKL
jgi:hypothetical protein